VLNTTMCVYIVNIKGSAGETYIIVNIT